MYQTIKELAASKGDRSAYAFSKTTRVHYASAKEYFRDPNRVPRPEVIRLICETYNVQPGVFLHYQGAKNEVAA